LRFLADGSLPTLPSIFVVRRSTWKVDLLFRFVLLWDGGVQAGLRPFNTTMTRVDDATAAAVFSLMSLLSDA